MPGSVVSTILLPYVYRFFNCISEVLTEPIVTLSAVKACRVIAFHKEGKTEDQKIRACRERVETAMGANCLNRGGNAIRGTYVQRNLGRAVSHGCVRLSVKNAATLSNWVKQEKMADSTVVIKRRDPRCRATGGGALTTHAADPR